MNPIESVEDRRKANDLNIKYLKRLLRVINYHENENDKTNNLFNDHSIICVEDRSVND